LSFVFPFAYEIRPQMEPLENSTFQETISQDFIGGQRL
jgi:hypothetical protein